MLLWWATGLLFGGHRFYLRSWRVGCVYIALNACTLLLYIGQVQELYAITSAAWGSLFLFDFFWVLLSQAPYRQKSSATAQQSQPKEENTSASERPDGDQLQVNADHQPSKATNKSNSSEFEIDSTNTNKLIEPTEGRKPGAKENKILGLLRTLLLLPFKVLWFMTFGLAIAFFKASVSVNKEAWDQLKESWAQFFSKNKVCVWCGSYSLDFEEGEVGDGFWEWRNKDGSRDKRYKNNRKRHGYTSRWLCKDCGARTSFRHYVSENPSKNIKVWKGTLLTEGEGNRSGKNFEKKGGSVSTSGSRKRDET